MQARTEIAWARALLAAGAAGSPRMTDSPTPDELRTIIDRAFSIMSPDPDMGPKLRQPTRRSALTSPMSIWS
jgi:hypothetical protein